MSADDESRFDRLLALMPRRFHISDNPPFGVGLVLCGHVNGDEEDGGQFMEQSGGIKNCKAGIWTSRTRLISREGSGDGEDGLECILYWVAPGDIDISQSVEEWESYEQETRKVDSEVSLSSIIPSDAKWRPDGSYFSDDGICCVISTEYLTMEAAKAVQFGTDEEEDDDWELGGYYEMLTLQGMEATSETNRNFTIGGMSFGQDEVGAPPRVAVAEQNGQVIAVRIYAGNDDPDEEDKQELLDPKDE